MSGFCFRTPDKTSWLYTDADVRWIHRFMQSGSNVAKTKPLRDSLLERIRVLRLLQEIDGERQMPWPVIVDTADRQISSNNLLHLHRDGFRRKYGTDKYQCSAESQAGPERMKSGRGSGNFQGDVYTHAASHFVHHG